MHLYPPQVVQKEITLIRFTVKRKSRSKHELAIRAAFGYDNPGFLVVASSPGSEYEIVIGYVELLPTLLSGEKGSGRCHLYKVLT